VIDLPNTVMSVRSKRIDVKSDQVSDIRLDQFQDKPPMVRIVMDLLKPSEYSSNAVGSVLTVRLNPQAVANQSPQVPTVPAFTQGVEPAVVPVSPGSNGAIVMAGSRIADGASVSAGADTAVLRLTRGGEVRLCPGTTVSVTQSKNGKDMMLGMSTGALETHYTSGQSADAILTPDFRILLAGPGDFQYAISADSRGNTCVRALPGNTAPIIVSELMGDGSYQVKPSEQVMFHSGKLTAAGTDVPASCGCPAPPIPALRAANDSAPEVPESKTPANMRLARPEDEGKPIEVPTANSGVQSGAPPPSQVTMSVSPETAPVPAAGPNEVHVKVEAPFVFRAADPAATVPAPATEAKQLPVADMQRPEPPAPTVVPAPPPQKPAEHHGVLGKIKGFFSSVFH
jgi:AMIN domain